MTTPALEKLPQNIVDELSCSICLELYQQPVLLPCTHTFCRGCLRAVMACQDADHRAASRLNCPLCRCLVPLHQGINGLPGNWTLHDIIATVQRGRQGPRRPNSVDGQILIDAKTREHVQRRLEAAKRRWSESRAAAVEARRHQPSPGDQQIPMVSLTSVGATHTVSQPEEDQLNAQHRLDAVTRSQTRSEVRRSNMPMVRRQLYSESRIEGYPATFTQSSRVSGLGGQPETTRTEIYPPTLWPNPRATTQDGQQQVPRQDRCPATILHRPGVPTPETSEYGVYPAAYRPFSWVPARDGQQETSRLPRGWYQPYAPGRREDGAGWSGFRSQVNWEEDGSRNRGRHFDYEAYQEPPYYDEGRSQKWPARR